MVEGLRSAEGGDEMPDELATGFPMAELVARTGVPAATIRYYVTLGILPPPAQVARNRFLYDERHVECISLVRLLRERRHLSLEVISTMLPSLLESPESGAFRPEMWDQVVDAHVRSISDTSPAGRLIEAGINAFNTYGYADVRVDDVCRAALIAKGSFYRHFASKEELFFAACTTAGERAARELGERVGDRLLSAVELSELLEEAMAPVLPLFLDLLALTAQRRGGYAAVLGQLLLNLELAATKYLAREAAPATVPDPTTPPPIATSIVEQALMAGVRRLVEEPILESLQRDLGAL
jgi:AcrR family transcriptional regulator